MPLVMGQTLPKRRYKFTKEDLEILSFIIMRDLSNQSSPTYPEISERFGISRESVSDSINRLTREKFIQVNKGRFGKNLYNVLL